MFRVTKEFEYRANYGNENSNHKNVNLNTYCVYKKNENLLKCCMLGLIEAVHEQERF
jgi:hypothetical protein